MTNGTNLLRCQLAADSGKPFVFYAYAGKAKDMPRLSDSIEFACMVLAARVIQRCSYSSGGDEQGGAGPVA